MRDMRSTPDMPIDKLAERMLDHLFGPNVVLLTKFEYLRVPDGPANGAPEYYFTDRYRFFDIWYSDDCDWRYHLAVGLSHLYIDITNQKLDIHDTARQLMKDLMLPIHEE